MSVKRSSDTMDLEVSWNNVLAAAKKYEADGETWELLLNNIKQVDDAVRSKIAQDALVKAMS